MIANFTTSYVPEVQSPILSTNQPIEFGPTLSRLDDEKEKELENSLNKGSLELWEILLLDAKDYLLSMDYREAIYSINGAFENYIILRAKEMVEGVERKKRFLKKLNSEWPPSAYKIVDECLEFNNKSKVSIDDLNKMIKIIRTKREAVIHGEDVDDEDDLVIIAFEAITTFEKFV
jgi:flagellar motor switch protein FliG